MKKIKLIITLLSSIFALLIIISCTSNLTWAKTFGNNSNDYLFSIQQTTDNGYILVGENPQGILIIKLNIAGCILWQKTYGDITYRAESIQQTTDGGYIVGGNTNSSGAGDYDFIVLKLDENGIIQWQKSFGGENVESVESIQQTKDGGYIVGGYTESFGAGNSDFIILKLDENGIIQWQKTYGGNDMDRLSSIQQTNDGDYIAAGTSNSFGAGEYDYMILKLDKNGLIKWQKTYGGENNERVEYILQNKDNGYTAAGATQSFGAGFYDIWILKLDTEGNLNNSCSIIQDILVISENSSAITINNQVTDLNITCQVSSLNLIAEDANVSVSTQCSSFTWAKTYGSTEDDAAYAVQDTSDGGYIMAGHCNSVFGAEAEIQGYYNVSVIKLDCNKNIQWQKLYAFTGILFEIVNILETTNKEYIVSTYASTFGIGGGDIWVFKLDKNGEILWQKAYGGTGWDVANALYETNDGGYLLAGFTFSFGKNGELLIIKLNENGNLEWQKSYDGESWDIANSICQTQEGDILVAGQTNSTGNPDTNIWILKLSNNGTLIWQKTYTDTNYNGGIACIIRSTNDGNYIAAGNVYDNDPLSHKIWILKISTFGDIIWQKTYQGISIELTRSLQQTSDNGYILAGHCDPLNAEKDNIYVLKLNASGDIIWQKAYGGSGLDIAYSIKQISDGGYIIAGQTDSYGAGGHDIWFLKLDANGFISDDCSSQDASITPANSSIIQENIQVTISNTGCSEILTNAIPQDLNIVDNTQCINN